MEISSVSELSKKLENIRIKIEKYNELSYDKKYEEDWKSMLNELNNIKISVYKNKLFSDNEEFNDVKTEDIKFMLIAFYQSEILQKFMVNRKNILDFSLKFYDEFYKLLKNYNVLSKVQLDKYEKITKKNENGETDPQKKAMLSFEQMSSNRTEKIEMYKYKKGLSEKLKEFEKDPDKCNDNREYWVTYLNLCITKMYESIPLIYMEVDSIEYIEKVKKEKGEHYLDNQRKIKENEDKGKKMEMLKINSPADLLSLDPNNKLVQNLNFLLPNISNSNDSNMSTVQTAEFNFLPYSKLTTLDESILRLLPDNIRKEVFKNRNPTEMTIEEFGALQEKRMKEEEAKHKATEEKRKKEEEEGGSDDEEKDAKKKKEEREWDDWKDEHPKGSGNRMGK